MEIAIVPTGGPLGAAVHGVDLSRDPPQEVIDRITHALGEHLLLVFRSQDLDPGRILEIAEWFGGVYRPARDEPALGDESLDPILVVSNVHERGLFGSDRVPNHGDQEYLRNPSPATILYAVEVPSSGGETSWTNLLRAYDELPGRLKRRVEPLERWTTNPYAGGRTGVRGLAGASQRVGDGEYPIALHPLVRVQSGTGRRALCLSSITTGIRGVRGPGAGWRSRRLLCRLKRHVARPSLLYRHVWRPGDLVVWDNRFTTHERAAFDGAERRVLYRCQIAAS